MQVSESNAMAQMDEWMTIREMCAEFGVTSRALRFYESKELIFPRRDGTKRLYNRTDRARLKLILRGKRFGFSLEQIRQLLNLYEADAKEPVQLRAVYDAALERLEAMKRDRDELNAAIDELNDHIAWGKHQLDQIDEPAQAAE